MLRAILFDLFETLITESGTRPAGVSSLAPGLGCEREAFRKAWKAARPAVAVGHLSFREALRDIAGSLGSHVDDATLDRVRDERVRAKREPFTAIEPQIMVMLDHLRRRNLRLAVVSNCFAEDVAAWRGCSCASNFDSTVFSFDVGVAKPDPRIYLEATQRLGVDVSEAWFVGDGGDGELTGAEQAGLRAFKALWFLKRWPHFRDEQHLSATLTSVDDLVTLVDQSLGASRVQQFPGSSQEFV
jgi:HAD superfamily hydrolase (TIGR01509 family)